MKTFKDIVNAAENVGWNVTDARESGFTVDEGITQFEFGKYSPAGEDFSFTVESDCPEGMVDEINAYSADFDKEDHIKMWIGAGEHGTDGVPSIKEIVKDADAIEDMLRELAESISYGILKK